MIKIIAQPDKAEIGHKIFRSKIIRVKIIK